MPDSRVIEAAPRHVSLARRTPNAAEILQTVVAHGLLDHHDLSDLHLPSEPRALARRLHALGALTAQQHARLLAVLSGLEVVDLAAEPPRSARVEPRALRAMAEQGWMPWRPHPRGGVIVVAHDEPDAEVATEIDRNLDGRLSGIVLADRTSIGTALRSTHADGFAAEASEGFARARPDISAKGGLARWQLAAPVVFVAAVVALGVVSFGTAIAALVVVAQLALIVHVSFKLVVASRALHRRRRGRLSLAVVSDDLPRYTILVPAYREGNVIEAALRRIEAIDYPPDRLEVFLLLEEDDAETIAAVSRLALPAQLTVFIVPSGTPRTKPRACNFALPFATGDYVVIFDAEDAPEPDQLRKAHAAFAADAARHPTRPRLACLQAKLHYYNPTTNLLSRLFAMEYAFWFDWMLPGLERLRLPIPLGGTSNHFRTDLLRELGGWDAYNVTEDADLGLRIAAHGYEVGVLDSVTWEEACSRVRPWIRQRTRWIKGYIVTAGVNSRDLRARFRETGVRGAISLVGLILSTPIAFLSYPILALFSIVQLAGLLPPTSMPAWLPDAVLLNSIIFGSVAVLLSTLAGAARYGASMLLYGILNPLYWFLHSAAAWRAVAQAVASPHVWEKTPHGLTHAVSTHAVSTHATIASK